MKTMILIASLMFTSVAFASQLRLNADFEPVCYTGNPKSALKELLALDFDPALSNGKIITGQRDGAKLLFALLVDENGTLVKKYVVPPCSGRN